MRELSARCGGGRAFGGFEAPVSGGRELTVRRQGAAGEQKVGAGAVGGPRGGTASSRSIWRRWRHVEQWLPARANNFEAAECRGTIQAKVITRPRLRRVSHCRRPRSSLRGRSGINARAPHMHPDDARGRRRRSRPLSPAGRPVAPSAARCGHPHQPLPRRAKSTLVQGFFVTLLFYMLFCFMLNKKI